ncbi:aminotransferase class V-fold PLP-dependent enzyme [Gordonia jinghuaiqii]|uniref:Aminotransferase class V-fold PLP-dependent enzyme n=1 Tax=Gordonia jinghuaiqii TaxID=2758710 RepID=A0A7D7R1L0_9ACTN|nr:aminotransferase class V-fold PLP-dependent enzyme [Gordonia jinghuaiqii]MCR5979147.1 aminotransferase class V-fold PLP-dependent enzyme [Gordonia jinghuaiqii]QMT00947.1 aminotransferase class V-fold PLP-dependent enzyme [Gordonia jinghuaiqii]
MTAVLSAPVSSSARVTPADTAASRGRFIPALAPVVGADVQVPLTDGRTVAYANLDYAASAPALSAVAAEVAAALGQYASVHRGAGHLSQLTTRRYEAARDTVRSFVRGRPDDTVVFTRNTTDAINLAASITPADVVVLDIEHHANLLPWCTPKDGRRRARVVTACDTIEDTLAALEAELASAPASLLAVTAASNVTGEVLPISRLASIAHRHGARILVDAAQLVAHRALSMVSHGIDYLAFSGHKAYAPFGAGVLIGRSDWFDAADPYLAGGGATLDVDVSGTRQTGTTWHTGAARHEAGSPNVLGAVSIAEACTALADLGPEAIGLHELRLCERLDAGLAAIDGVRPLRIFADSADRVGIAGFVVDGLAPRVVAEYLSDEHGIGVRDGKFCAHPLLKRLGHPGGAVRASFGAGTTSDDVDRLLDALTALAADAPTTRPELDEG